MKRALCLYLPFLSTDRLSSVRNAASKRRPQSRAKVDGSFRCAATGSTGTNGRVIPAIVQDPPGELPNRSCRHHAPVVTTLPHAQLLRIVQVSRSAYDLGIRPGQTLADAKVMVPHLITHEDDPAADRRQLESLATWANELSPIVHLEGDDTLIIDVTGCERLFKGEGNLLRRAIEGLEVQGFTVRGAIADAPGAAWACAHAHPDSALIVPPGRSVAYLAPLPVWSLRIGAKITDTLSAVGVDTVASLLHLPRSSLASRFGEEMLDRIDQALGDLPEVLIPYRPKPALVSRIAFGAAHTRLDVLQEAMQRALKHFCEQLTQRTAGVGQLFVTFYCPNTTPSATRNATADQNAETRSVTREVRLSQPTRSAKHLNSLLTVVLENLSLPSPVDSLMLWSRKLEPLDDWQDELFTTDACDPRKLGDLLDRLAIRLGPQAVVQPELRSEHQPERAFRYVSFVGSNGTPLVGSGGTSSQRAASFNPREPQRAANSSSRGLSRADTTSKNGETPRGLQSVPHPVKGGVTPPGTRPLRLAARPVAIAVTSMVPEGPPIALILNGTQHRVVDRVGPERIETGWWRGPHLKRDYYRVTTENGDRCWLFRDRDTGKWFLHGWFD